MPADVNPDLRASVWDVIEGVRKSVVAMAEEATGLIEQARAEGRAAATQASASRVTQQVDETLGRIRNRFDQGELDQAVDIVRSALAACAQETDRREHFEAEAERHRAAAAQLRLRVEGLEKIFRWALGDAEGEFPEREPGQDSYWWRKEIRARLEILDTMSRGRVPFLTQ